MKKSTILAVKELHLLRGKKTILEQLSWTIQSGENWAILGRNGSGKTSLLKVITGYTPPTRGEIFVLGEKYGETDWRELRKKIGWVSSSLTTSLREDEPVLNLILSGKEAMLNYWGESKKEEIEKAESVIKTVQLEQLKDQSWGELSQGEKQRALLGRALMADYKILILDEPCAGMDLVTREQFLSFLQKLASSPNPPVLILVTHHVEEIIPCFTHLLLMKQGKIIFADQKEKLTSKELSDAFEANLHLEKGAEKWRIMNEPELIFYP